ncbi:hypothetical protein PR048_004753 [Dryococelus australis]|uniref:Uncharacterized protein n=1 Tax=Dryococelus australis TaxID=614101 RepID=A0ABQ9I692_9NEOP|nr:hypothetical protein PR048_004753 [Dryococelus australis]
MALEKNSLFERKYALGWRDGGGQLQTGLMVDVSRATIELARHCDLWADLPQERILRLYNFVPNRIGFPGHPGRCRTKATDAWSAHFRLIFSSRCVFDDHLWEEPLSRETNFYVVLLRGGVGTSCFEFSLRAPEKMVEGVDGGEYTPFRGTGWRWLPLTVDGSGVTTPRERGSAVALAAGRLSVEGRRRGSLSQPGSCQHLGEARRTRPVPFCCDDQLCTACRGVGEYTNGPTVRTHDIGNYGRGGVVVKLLASHTGEPGSISGGLAPGFSHVGIVPDDSDGQWGFLGDLPFPPPLHSGAFPYSPHFTLIGSQDPDVKRHPNHSTFGNSLIHHGSSEVAHGLAFGWTWLRIPFRVSRLRFSMVPRNHSLANAGMDPHYITRPSPHL